MQRAATLRGVSLELGLCDRGRLGNRPREVFAEPDDSGPLFLVRGLQPFGIVLQARLERLDQGALVLGDLLQPLSEPPLRTLEILMPRREPLLHLALRPGERLREAVAQPLLALFQGHAPRLCEAALLLGVRGQRIGSRTGQSPFEFARSALRLALDGRRQLGLRPLELPVERPTARHAAAKPQRADDGQHARHQPGRDDRKLGRRGEREGDPCADRPDSDRDSGRDQHAAARKLEGRTGQRRSGDDDACGEDDLERGLDSHATIVKPLFR